MRRAWRWNATIAAAEFPVSSLEYGAALWNYTKMVFGEYLIDVSCFAARRSTRGADGIPDLSKISKIDKMAAVAEYC